MADKGLRALIVEDDPSWQQILGEILMDMGLVVDFAGSYDEAVKGLRENPHRLAILDLSLGGKDHNNQDGLRVAEAVRRFDPGCLILFLTGFATVELAVQVMKEQGAFTCLRKEVFRRAEFRKIVNEALAQAPTAAGRSEYTSPWSETTPVLDAVQESSTRGVEQTLVLVVEDDAGWRSVLTELLEDGGYGVRSCSSFVEATGLLRRNHFHLAVIDLALASSLFEENLDGYRLLSNLQKSNIPVIVVSGFADPARIQQAFEEQRIFACLEKQSFDRKAFLKTVKNAASQAVEDPVLRSLTDREREVLVLLARGLTNKEIARDLTITPNTVKRHLKSLFIKLDVNTRSAASAKAINLGLGEKT